MAVVSTGGFSGFLNRLKGVFAPPVQINGENVKIVEVGTTGTEIFSGYINEEYLKDLTGRPWADQIDMMRRSDANVKMCLRALKLPLISSDWRFEVTEQSKEAELQKLLLEKAFFIDIDKSITRTIFEISSMIDFGFSLMEITHQVKLGDAELGDYNTLKSFAWRSQRTIDRWNIDRETGKLATVTQIANGDLGTLIDIDARFLSHFSIDQEGDNFEGVSLLRSMFGAWKRKNRYLQLVAAGIEKYAIPTPVLTIPAGKENSPEYKFAEKMLRCYTSSQKNYIMKPVGWDLTIEPVTFDAETIKEMIMFENQEMVNSILAGFLLLGQTGTGSHSLSSTLADFYGQTLQYLADHITEVLAATVFQPLVKMNFGDRPLLVQFKCDGLKEKADVAWATMIKDLTTVGVIKADDELEDNVRDKMGLPPVDEATSRTLAAHAPKADAGSEDGSEDPKGDGTTPPEGGKTGTEDIQKQALNGAQVSSMVEIVTDVSNGSIPRDAAVQMIVLAFQVDEAMANKILGSAGNGFEPTKPEPAPGAFGAAGAAPPKETDANKPPAPKPGEKKEVPSGK